MLKPLKETPLYDSLRVHYGNRSGSTVTTPNTSAFDNLKSIGFDLIWNDSLRVSSAKLYSERYTYLGKLGSGFDAHLQLNDPVPLIYAKVVTVTVWLSAHPMNAEALMDDNECKNVVRMNVFTGLYGEGLPRR